MRRWMMLAGLLAVSAPAWAMSSAAGAAGGTSSAGSAGSSASSDSSSDNDKLVLEARVDAASFVASDGAIRGARLEAALRSLRERDAGARAASDLQLAQAILAL